MNIQFHRDFKKRYEKHPALQDKIDQRLEIFARDEFSPLLHNHSLNGKYIGHRSVNITGSYRAIYRLKDPDTALFMAVGTHSELYGK